MNCETKKDRQQGKVWLVGAGPSDVELITVKGKRLLEEADVIVFDRLVGQGILMYGRKDAEYIDVGKRSGHHPIPQEEINEILLREAKSGKKVVRLKGGDPFVFGRGAEEIELLLKEGVPYEIVPGITSAISVAAYAGIPVTHRNMASSLHIVTAHKKAGGIAEKEFESLVTMGGTLVFLMGVTSLPEVTEGLLKAGMNPNTPSAVLEKGTTAAQRKVCAPLSELAGRAKEEQITSPAIILVGDVCSLSEMSWYEKRPLSGMRIIVTRPRERQGRLSQMLREEGAEVFEFPAIAVRPAQNTEVLEKALAKIDTYRWLVLTSPSGAEQWMKFLRERRIDMRTLSHLKLACIGTGTASIMETHGWYADLIPDRYDGVHLGRLLAEKVKAGEKVLIARAAQGNPQLLEELMRAEQVQITDAPLYEIEEERYAYIDLRREFSYERTYAMFTSASTVRGFVNAAEGIELGQVHAFCIGKQTEKAARAFGMKTLTAKEATLESLIALVKSVQKGENLWEQTF